MIAQAILNGLVSGTVIALPALALSLIFGIAGFPNFAVGATLTAGAYIAWTFNATLGLPILAAAALAAAVIASLAALSDRLVFRLLRERSSVTLLVASVGLAFLIENVIRLFYGNWVRNFAIEVARPLRLFEVRINHEQMIATAVTLGCMLTVWALLKHTPLGRAMRAVADDADLAAIRGIRRENVLPVTWAISGALTAIAGVLVGMDTAIEPLMGWNHVISIFAASILGGIGNPFGAVAGALVLGVVEEVSTLFLPSSYRTGVAFAIMSAMLLVRPWGLFGQRPIAR